MLHTDIYFLFDLKCRVLFIFISDQLKYFFFQYEYLDNIYEYELK